MAKYIVTGGAGFIGSHLTRQLLADGHEVVVVDNLSSGFYEYLTPQHPNMVFVKADIADEQHFRKCYKQFEGADGVFHLAARARIQPSIQNPRPTHDSNVTGTFNILEMMRELKIPKIVYSASSSYYGRNPIPCVETQREDCLNPYSLTKYMGEKYCKVWGELYGIKNICLRYFNVYGERSPTEGPYATVIGLFFRQALKDRQALTIVGDGEQRRDFTHVSDVVRANIAAMKSEDVTGMSINVGTGSNYTVNQVAEFILSALRDRGFKGYLATQFIPFRPGESRATLADVGLADIALGWKPTVDFRKAIEDLTPYYMEMYQNYL